MESSSYRLPLLVVFGLDYTLWPFFLDTHITPPFAHNSRGDVIDAFGQIINYYKDVPEIFVTLKSKRIRIAATSLSADRIGTVELLKALGWKKYLMFVETSCLHKHEQILRVCRLAGVYTSDIIFFDDSDGNIEDARRIGVVSVKVVDGMTMELLDYGFELYHETMSNQTMMS